MPQAEVRYAKGCEVIDKHFPESELMEFPMEAEETRLMEEALQLVAQSDVTVAVLGGSEKTVRESFSRTV